MKTKPTDYEAVVDERDEARKTLQSIIEWWEDDHDFPYQGAKVDPGEACQWYKRRMMMMANAARTTLTKLDAE